MADYFGPYRLDAVYHEVYTQALMKVPTRGVGLVILDPPYDEWPSMDLALISAMVGSGVVICFAWQPEATDVMMRMRAFKGMKFREEIIWFDPQGTLVSKQRVLKTHRNILVFSRGDPHVDHRQGAPIADRSAQTKGRTVLGRWVSPRERVYRPEAQRQNSSVWEYPRDLRSPGGRWSRPLELMKRLIRTYSELHTLVLDPRAGYGEALLAAQQLDRPFLGFESRADLFQHAEHLLRYGRPRVPEPAEAPLLSGGDG